MSLVKWVLQFELLDEQSEPKELQVPVIPIADLAEVVEGLRKARKALLIGSATDQMDEVTKIDTLLTQLEAHMKGGA